MKKAQMEVFGLVIIVILGAIFLVFALANSLGGEELQHKKFSDEGFANSFVAVLAKTEVEVCREEYSVLAKDCARNPSNPSITCDGKTSCEIANETASELIARTLGEWGEKYRYRIRKEGSDVIDPIARECGEEDDKEAPGIQVLPLYPSPGSAEMMLEICE